MARKHAKTKSTPQVEAKQLEVFFATCAPGLEPLLHAEARALGLARTESQVGGVRFEGSLEDGWRANLWMRTAIRVLWRIDRFPARDEEQLYETMREIDWRRFLGADGTLAVTAQTRDSNLDHSLFIAQKSKDAIVDRFRERGGTRPSVDKDDPDLAVHVHIWRDRATVSIDLSGDSLHKRGWRQYQGRAPLAETLAAACIELSGWDRRSPLVDPFCGSGTLLIEAALLAGNVAPGIFRDEFAFERLPGHDAARWSTLLDEAREAIDFPKKLVLIGYDRDPRVVEGARRNLESAGLDDSIEIREGEATRQEFRRGWNAWIVTNPPYGERLGEDDNLEDMYTRFGRNLKRYCSGFHLSLLSGNSTLATRLGLRPLSRKALKNGALECELLSYRID